MSEVGHTQEEKGDGEESRGKGEEERKREERRAQSTEQPELHLLLTQPVFINTLPHAISLTSQTLSIPQHRSFLVSAHPPRVDTESDQCCGTEKISLVRLTCYVDSEPAW